MVRVDAAIIRVGKALYQRLFAPIKQLLGNRRRVLLVPDVNLNLVQFAALVDENGQYLVENYDVSYPTSGRELLRIQEPSSSETVATVIANPAFDLTQPLVKCPKTAGFGCVFMAANKLHGLDRSQRTCISNYAQRIDNDRAGLHPALSTHL